MRGSLQPLLTFQGAASIPPMLAAVLDGLEATRWPEVATLLEQAHPRLVPG